MTTWRTLAARPNSIVTVSGPAPPLFDQPKPGFPSIRCDAFQEESYSLVKSLILPPLAAKATFTRADGAPGSRTSVPITSTLFSSIQLPPPLRRKVKRQERAVTGLSRGRILLLGSGGNSSRPSVRKPVKG